jgi:hypothetical protein
MVDSPTCSRGVTGAQFEMRMNIARGARHPAGFTSREAGEPEAMSRPHRRERPATVVSCAGPTRRSRMQAHQLTTTAQREIVRGAGLRPLSDIPTGLDSRRAAPPLSCDLFRSAGIVPTALGDAGSAPPEADLSRRSPPRE